MSVPRTKKRQVCELSVPPLSSGQTAQIGTRTRKLVMQAIEDGVFKAELNELLTRELAEDGYSGVTVRRTTARTDIIIRATRTQKVLGMMSL
jgi:hypothetical protein